MVKGKSVRRWILILILLFFLLFHQLDVLLLRPTTIQMVALLNTRDGWVEPLIILSIGLSILFGLFWGVNFDRHSRNRILALISFLWGVSSWLVGISPTLATYVISSAAGGIDNLSNSGVYALVGDFFGSKNRGKILGLLLVSQPMAFLLMILISNHLPQAVNWRFLLLIMGCVAFIFTILFYFFLPEPKRGAREQSMNDLPLTGTYLFDWELAKENLKTSSMPLILIFSLFGSMPWFIITGWISPLLQAGGQVSPEVVAQRLLPGLIALMIGYPVGGFLGDLFAQKRDTGRVLMALIGVLLPPIFLLLAFVINDLFSRYFVILLILMGFFMSFSWPNLIAMIFDIALPEVRAFITAIALIMQTVGSLLGPFLVSVLQTRISLLDAFLTVTISSWLLALLLLIGLIFSLPRDVESLRRHMAYRSHLERRLLRPKPNPQD